MNKKITHVLVILVILALAACDQVTPSPTMTQQPSASATNVPTVTPKPPTTTPTQTSTSTPTSTPTPTETPAPIQYGPDNFPEGINPLTGLAVDPALLDRRPVAIKVNIVPRTTYRPPWGLSLADIVYDYYHNAGYSRFHAIFYGQDAELVGPIRSGRLLDNELIRMYQSIFAYGSADQLINNRLLNADYSNRVVLEGRQATCPPAADAPLCRYEPAGLDFLVGGTQAIHEYVQSRGVSDVRQDLNGMSFFSTVPENGSEANQVYVRYSGDNYTRWDYDPQSGKYLRFQDDVYDQGQGEQYAPLTDRLNDQQIAADNVVVVYARHEYYQQPPHEIFDILLSGEGKAYAYRDGQVYELSWSRPGTNSVLRLVYPDGTPFPFKPGTTWFQVIGQNSQLSQPEEGVYRFLHQIP